MNRVQTFVGALNQWGNGTALRLSKRVLATAGFTQGTSVRMIVEPGRIVVEPVKRRPTLDEMLAEFDPAIHGGEAMAFEPLGKEVP